MAAHTMQIPVLRELYREIPSGALYRVVYAERGESHIVLCNIFGSTLKLISIPLEEFYVRCMPGYGKEGRLIREEPENDPFGPMRRPRRSTPAGEDQSDLNWKRIEQLANDPELFRRTLKSGSDRKNILQDIADASGVTIQRIRKLHREYIQRGMTQDAVSSDLWRCGRRHQPARYEEGEDAKATIVSRNFAKRPGRTPSRHGTHAIRTPALERLFEQYIDIYLTSKVGPWRLDISEELSDEIRRFNAAAIFPATSKSRSKGRAASST